MKVRNELTGADFDVEAVRWSYVPRAARLSPSEVMVATAPTNFGDEDMGAWAMDSSSADWVPVTLA